MRLRMALLVLPCACGPRERPRAVVAQAPLAWAPPYARGVAELDLSALRRSPALARWLGAGAPGDCAERLSAKVRRVALVSLDGGPGSVGVVLAGELSAPELLSCARERRADSLARALTHRGVSFTRITDARGEVEVDLLPPGVALLGPPWVARALLDAGISYAEGHGETPVLRALWEPLPDAHVRLAWLPPRELRTAMGIDGLRASATAGEAVSLTLTAVTPGEESALALAQRGLQWRGETAPALQHAALRRLVEGLRLRADGRAVSASLSLDGPTLTALGSAFATLAAGL